MRRRGAAISLCVFNVLAIMFLLTLPSQSQTCPPCYYNQQPMTGGCCSTCPDGSGRRVIKIRIDGTWNSGGGTDPKIWNGVVGCPTTSGCNPPLIGAIERWNNASDLSGNKSNYCFVIDQSAQGADITITKASVPNGCAGFIPGGWNPLAGGPYTIALPNSTTTFNHGIIAGRVAHEFGHTIGLANCSGSTSIMNGSNPNCTRNSNQVQPNDVAMSNQHADPSRRPNCTKDATSGQDSVCNDYTDSDQDGYCSNVDCNDNNPNIHPGATENCSDGYDNDCDGAADRLDNNCWCPWSCTPPTGSYCPYVYDPCRYPGPGCPGGYTNNGAGCCCYWSPILIDVLGNGFDMTDGFNGVQFDPGGDGSIDQVAWTVAGSDDAWLVLDRNGNSLVDNGTEMFGNFTDQPPSNEANGFIALSEFDKLENGGNNDGRVSVSDGIYSSLRLWQDTNHNGISEPTELLTLDSVDLFAIDLDYRESRRRDRHGNQFKYRAKVYDARGAHVGRWAWDVFPVVNP